MDKLKLLQVVAKLDGQEIGYRNYQGLLQPCFYCSSYEPIKHSSNRLFTNGSYFIPCIWHLNYVIAVGYKEVHI